MLITNGSDIDLEAITALFTSHELPTQGIEHILHHFLVAHDESGQLAACAGFERYVGVGLLRSVAVADDMRGTGLGTEIVQAVIDKARSEGVEEFVLLTISANDFFANKFGFEVTTREEYANAFDGSWEWNLPRCSSAVVMMKDLTE